MDSLAFLWNAKVFVESLEQLEYLKKTGGYANKGFKYKIVFWDDLEEIKKKLVEAGATVELQ